MTNVLAHAIPQVEPPAVGVHLLWTGPWQWVWSLDGWSIQRREFRRTVRERRCVRLGDVELADLRRTHRRATSLGPATFRTGTWMDSVCEVYTLELAGPTPAVTVTATAGRLLVIALRGNRAVGYLSGAGSVSGQLRADGITSVVAYAIKISALEWCAEFADQESEDRLWEAAPFVVEHLQLPLTELVPALGGAAGELAEATARLLPNDTLADEDFEHIASMLRVPVAAVSPPRPADQVALLRAAPDDDVDESMALDPLRVLMSHPTWRRVLGFGWFDDDAALVPGQVYEYRITGSFPAEDLADRVYGFHTPPAGTPLPACFWIGDLRVRLPQPVTVALDPTAFDAGGTTELSRRGIPIRPRDETWWHAPEIDGNSVVVDFPAPVDSVVLEMAPGPAISWKTFTHGGTVAAGPGADTSAGAVHPAPIVRRRLPVRGASARHAPVQRRDDEIGGGEPSAAGEHTPARATARSINLELAGRPRRPRPRHSPTTPPRPRVRRPLATHANRRFRAVAARRAGSTAAGRNGVRARTPHGRRDRSRGVGARAHRRDRNKSLDARQPRRDPVRPRRHARG